MHKFIAALALAALTFAPLACAGPRASAAVTQEQLAVMEPLRHYIESFNKGDIAAAGALCADEMSIIDEFPPHEWHGPGTGARWMSDYDADAKRNGITDGIVTLHEPKHVLVNGDRAYVVAPADYTYKMHGKQVEQRGSLFTFALHKAAPGWRITGWTWSRN
jgi:ketosteroid isomerase-like protein